MPYAVGIAGGGVDDEVVQRGSHGSVDKGCAGRGSSEERSLRKVSFNRRQRKKVLVLADYAEVRKG